MILHLDLLRRKVDESRFLVRLHQHAFAVGGDFESLALAEYALLSFLQVEEGRRALGRLSLRDGVDRRAGDAKIINPIPDHAQVAVIGRSDRQADDTIKNFVEIHLDGRRRLAGVARRRLLFLRRRLLLRSGADLIAARFERGIRLLRKRNQIDPLHILIGVLPLRIAVKGMKIPARGDEKKFAVVAEGGRIGVEPALRRQGAALSGQSEEMDAGFPEILRLGVGDPLRIGRPDILGVLAAGVGRDRGDRLAPDIDVAQALRPVAPKKLLAVGRPNRRVVVGVGAGGELRRGPAPILRPDEIFILTRPIRHVSDPFSVWRPGAVALVNPRSVGKVADRAGLGRDGEKVAARHHHRALAIGRRLDRSDELLDVDQSAAPAGKILPDRNRHPAHPGGGEVEMPEAAGLLEDNAATAERGKLDIEVPEVRVLVGSLRRQVVGKKIEASVPIGQKVDAVIRRPHRDDILGRVAGDVLQAAGFEIENPDIVRHSATVLLPGAELAKDPVVGHFGIVGRKTEKSAGRHRQLARQIAVEPDGVKLADKVVERTHPRTEDDRGLGVFPGHDDIVRAHPVAQVVPAQRGGDGEASGNPAFGRHDIDLGVAVVLGGESELPSVRGKPGKDGVARPIGQAAGDAALHRNGVKLAGIGKHDRDAVGGGKSKQAGLVRIRRSLSGQTGEPQKKHRANSEETSHAAILHKAMKQARRAAMKHRHRWKVWHQFLKVRWPPTRWDRRVQPAVASRISAARRSAATFRHRRVQLAR